MCGIGGILRRRPSTTAEQDALRLQQALLHRGPDGRGIYTSPDGIATLVHTRLAILDPSSAAQQPMARGRYRISFNGEIYNFRELREELVQQGETFVTQSDTEVLLALYARHGAACLSRLRGMFALAIWDENDHSCFLARDRFGIKPLYYGFSRDGDLFFASEVKALIATGQMEHRLDPSGLESFLAFGSVAEPATLIASIRCLKAGHWLRWTRGCAETQRYFAIDFSSVQPSGEEARAITQAALLDSVRHHFVSDAPVGIFLSGGLDSGALVALAHAAGVKPLATFSLAAEDTTRDESDAARRLAKFFGTQHHEMLLTRELAAHWVDNFLGALDQPTVDGFNTYCACRLARDHGYKVVLSGIGGDELFGGYPSFSRVPQLLALARGLRFLRKLVSPLARGWEGLAPDAHSGRMAAYLQGDATPLRAYRTFRSLFSPHERRKISRSLLNSEWDESENFADEPSLPQDPGDAVSYLELTFYLRNQLLRDADVMSMAHGLELRVPFLDHRLFETLRTIPSTLRLGPNKRLLREATPGLPPWHAAEPKRGFSFPYDDWLASTWGDLRKMLSGAPRVPLGSWSREWSLIVLSHWLRRHNFPGWHT